MQPVGSPKRAPMQPVRSLKRAPTPSVEGRSDSARSRSVRQALREAQSGVKGYYPFTAPMVMPRVKNFWNIRKIAMIGMEPRAAPAIIRP